jgi:hypothetical protein
MKNKLFFAGMAALALTFGLVMTGCDNGSGGGGGDGGGGLWSQLIQGNGTWIPSASGSFPSFKFQDYEYGEYKAKGLEVRDDQGRQKIAGMCDLDGDTITAGSTTFEAKVENDLLTISGWSKPNEAATYNGTYKRKN